MPQRARSLALTDRPDASTLALEYSSLTLHVRSTEASLLEWLREFLAPAFRPGAGAGGEAIAVTIDPVAYERLVESQPADANEIDCFTLDRQFGRAVCWPTASGRRVIHVPRSDAIFLGPDSHGPLTILAARDAMPVRRSLMRVVRELATAHVLRCGGLQLHAAAVQAGSSVIAFAGPRRSGKSTLLLHALTAGRAHLLSSDRLVIAAGREPVARGMPTIVSLRDGTLSYFPRVRARAIERGYIWHVTKAEATARSAAGSPVDVVRADGTLRGLSPAQLCDLTDVDAGDGGVLGLVVFTRIDADVASHDVQVLTTEDAALRLRQNLFLASEPERSAAAFDGGSPPFSRDSATLDRLCADLATKVPCIALRLGPDAFPPEPGLGGRRTVWNALQEHTG